jgi:hypothetical protein
MSSRSTLSRQVPLMAVLAVYLLGAVVLWIVVLEMNTADKNRDALIGAAAALSAASAAFVGTVYTNTQLNRLNRANQEDSQRVSAYTALALALTTFKRAEERARDAEAISRSATVGTKLGEIATLDASVKRTSVDAARDQVELALAGADVVATPEFRELLTTFKQALQDAGSARMDFSADSWCAVQKHIPRELDLARE